MSAGKAETWPSRGQSELEGGRFEVDLNSILLRYQPSSKSPKACSSSSSKALWSRRSRSSETSASKITQEFSGDADCCSSFPPSFLLPLQLPTRSPHRSTPFLRRPTLRGYPGSPYCRNHQRYPFATGFPCDLFTRESELERELLSPPFVLPFLSSC